MYDRPMISKELIQSPRQWQLTLSVHPAEVEVDLAPLSAEGQAVHETLPLDKSLSPTAAFEELIYQNPVLLGDFNSINILIDTTRFTIVPSSIRSQELRDQMLKALWPDAELTALAHDIDGTDDTLLMGLDPAMASFLNRTFLDASIQHPLALMASRVAAEPDHDGKVFAHVRPGAVDVVAVEGSVLKIANTFAAPSADDATYYISAAAQTAGYDLLDTKIIKKCE